MTFVYLEYYNDVTILLRDLQTTRKITNFAFI